MMTATASYYTIVSAIVAAEKAFLGPDRLWRPTNAQQKVFIEKFLGPCRVDLDKIPELETFAALSEVPINEFLKKRGFSIQLDKFPKLVPPERAWGAASILDLRLEWLAKGKEALIDGADGVRYPGASLEAGVEVYSVQTHNNPIARVETKTGDMAYFTVLDEALEGSALLHKAQMIAETSSRCGEDYEGLKFPMVDLDHKVDIDWLKDMMTKDDEGFINKITQALQQTKFKMNHLGARVKDAVAISGMRMTVAMPSPKLVIDKPFLFWIERAGLSRPIFVSYVTQDHWKDPGSLEM